MRDVRKHGIACAADGFELRLVANHLHLEAVDHAGARNHCCACFGVRHLQVLDRLGASIDARLQDGAAEVARATTVFEAWLENVTAELPHSLLGRYVQKASCLRVQVADDAVLVDGVDAFDDPAEHCLRLCLAAA